MVRQFFRKAAVGAVLAAALAAGNEANAGWGSSGGSSGYYSSGSSGSYGSSGSSGSYGSSGGGPVRRFFARMHARHHSSGSSGSYGSSGHYYGSSGSSGGSSGHVYHGSSGGSSGYHGSSGGSSGHVYHGSSGGSSGGYVTNHAGYSHSYAASSVYPSSGIVMSGVSNSPVATAQQDAVLAVRVPGEAKIYVNGTLTKTPGELRRYVSRNLASGQSYTYEVRAEAEVDGRVVQQTKQATLRAGETLELAFNLSQETPDELTTRLQLEVPEDAKVFLSGNPTSAQGAERVYETTRLKAGEKWSDYTIRVELERDGKTLRRERTILLSGGETKKLSFRFDDTDQQVAAR